MSRPTENPALKLAFRLCLEPYRHLAQFVSIPTASMAHVSIYRTCRCSPCSARRRRRDTRELFALFSRVSPNPREQYAHLNKKIPQKKLAVVFKLESFGKKSLNKDGHLITEDSVLPTTAPGGAPEQNRCYQTPAYFYLFSPLRPLRSRARCTSHRSLRYAPAGGWRYLVFVSVSS